jgi:hypothetical protein
VTAGELATAPVAQAIRKNAAPTTTEQKIAHVLATTRAMAI